MMQIKIKAPFTDQYTLILESDMSAIDMQMRSKARIRWDFNVLKVNEDQLEARLILLNHELLETNNPYVKEVAEVTRIFGRMYEEIHVVCNHAGKVLQVLNLDIITGKWAQIKAEMEKQLNTSPDLKNIIQMNDDIFNRPDKVASVIENNEFFTSYFGKIYGREIPYQNANSTTSNFLNTIQLQWRHHARFAVDKVVNDTLHLSLEGTPSVPQDRDFCRKAYSQFADRVDINALRPLLTEKADYKLSANTGNLITATILKEERATFNLYINISYQLMNSIEYARYQSMTGREAVAM